jgi:hypothetical protein
MIVSFFGIRSKRGHFGVTVTEIHRIKGLQKERVPINIEVAPTIPKGALR